MHEYIKERQQLSVAALEKKAKGRPRNYNHFKDKAILRQNQQQGESRNSMGAQMCIYV